MNRSIALASLSVILPWSVSAALIELDANFSTSGQSMWGPGEALIMEERQFVGASWQGATSINAITGNERSLVPLTGITVQELVPGTGISIQEQVPGTGITVQEQVPGTGITVQELVPGTGITVQEQVPGTGITVRRKVSGTGITVKEKVPGTGTYYLGQWIPAEYVNVKIKARYIDVDIPAEYVDVDIPAEYVAVDIPAEFIDVAIPAEYIDVDIPAEYISVDIPPEYVDTRTGVDMVAGTTGRVGFEVGMKANSGSVDTEINYDLLVEIPDDLESGEFFNLNVGSNLEGGVLSTNFPTLEADLSLVLEAAATFDGTACVALAGCEDFSHDTGIIGGTQELISLNSEGEGGVTYFGDDPVLNTILNAGLTAKGLSKPTGLPASVDVGLVEVTAHLPQPNADGGLVGSELAANGQDDLVDFLIDVDNAVSLGQTGGLTDSLYGSSVEVGELGSLSFDIVDVDMGPTIDLEQSFEFTPSLFVDFEFSAPVDVFGFGFVSSLAGISWDELPDFAFMDGQTLVTSTFYLGFLDNNGLLVRDAVSFLNELFLDIDGELTIDFLAGELDLAALGSYEFGVGNLFAGKTDFFTTPAFFMSEFALGGFNDLTTSFAVNVGDYNPPGGIPVPTPGSLFVFSASLLGLLISRRKRINK